MCNPYYVLSFIVKDTDIRVEEHFGQQTANTSSQQSRPQQGLRRTGSFGEVVICVLSLN